MNQSILYVEPIYLEAEASPIPVLRRIVVGLKGGRIEWGETLQEALYTLFGEPIPVTTDETGGKSIEQAPITEVLSSANLTKRAIEQYDQAQKYLRSGNWAKYGEEMDKLRQTLMQMQKEKP
jgi:uncharacterized membrane protein (UPF0182 family)